MFAGEHYQSSIQKMGDFLDLFNAKASQKGE